MKKSKDTKRKAKVKAKKQQAILNERSQSTRLAVALERLCAPVMPEYIDDSNGLDLVGRRIVWQMGQIAWNFAVTRQKKLADGAFQGSRLDAKERETVRNEIAGLVKRKYAEFPNLRTAIRDISVSLVNGTPCLKVRSGDTFPELPMPDQSEEHNEILTKENLFPVLDLLDSLKMRYWVDGGWGVDILAGKQNREHRDLDIDFDADFLPAVLTALQNFGYQITTDWRPCRIELYHPEYSFIDIHPLAIAADGSAKQADTNGGWYEFKQSYFSQATFEGRKIPCLSLEAQKLFHTGYELREKDLTDIRILNTLAEHISEIEQKLRNAGNPEKAAGMQRFFKTGPGEYGEGDQFIGLTSPQMRQFAKEYRTLSLTDLDGLLHSPYHEVRATSLAVLVGQYEKGDATQRKEIFDFYLKHTQYINNWDLVDISAPGIVGEHLLKRKRTILRKLAASSLLWEQRIAMVSTLTLIRHGEYADTLELAELLLAHPHNLMHKACGWMLREVGKCDLDTLTAFLMKHKSAMPRTMLRYAIEHYSPEERKVWLKK